MRQIQALSLALVMLGIMAAACASRASTPTAESTPAPSEVSAGSIQTATIESGRGVVFDDRIEMVSFRLNSPALRPGGSLEVTVRWRGLAPIGADLRAFAELTDARDEEVAGDTDVIGTRARATSTWAIQEEGEHTLRMELPARIPRGQCELRVGVLDRDEVTRLPVSFPGSVPGGPTWTTLAIFTGE
jgi:hypothetical protein